MTESRPFTVLDFVLFGAVLLLAAVFRIGYVVCCTDAQHPQGSLFVQDVLPPLPSPPPADNPPIVPEHREQDALVDNVRFDRGFIAKAPFANQEEPTAHTAPGYPVLVGLLARVVDPASLDGTVQWIQVGVGSLTAGLYFLFARRAFRSSFVAAVAGILTAIYPFWVINTAAVNDGTLTAFLLSLVMFLGVRAGQSGGAFSSLLFGLMLAALALTRAYCFPFTIVALAWFLLRSRLIHFGWLCALVAFLGFVIGLAPWTVRNYQLFGEHVPITDTALYLPITDTGLYHLWVGNNPKATGGPVTDEMVKDAEDRLNAKAPLKLAEMPQPERYAHLGTIARDTIQNDPLAFIHRRLSAALDFFFGEEFFRDGAFAVHAPEQKNADDAAESLTAEIRAGLLNWSKVILAAMILILLGLGVLGWRWTYGFATESMPAALAVIWIPLPYILTHAEALHGARLPLDGVLLCYVAFALCCFVPVLGRALFAGSVGVRSERLLQ